MTTFTDFYTQNAEAFALISKIRLPEDFNPKKKYYFDDLVMSNILSFIPKYPKKAIRSSHFRVGIFEELSTLGEHENRETYNIYIIKKITSKMIKFRHLNQREERLVSYQKKKKRNERGNFDYVEVEDSIGNKFCINAKKLIPIRNQTYDNILTGKWFVGRNDDTVESIEGIKLAKKYLNS